MKQPILDTHVHFWDPQLLQYDWLEQAPPIRQPFRPFDLFEQAQRTALQEVIFVEADCRRDQAILEAEWVSQLAQREERIVGIVAFAPVATGVQVHEELDRLARLPLVKGVRQLIQSEPPGFCRQPTFIAGVRQLAAYGFSFDICVYHHQLSDVLVLVEQCPDVRFVLDHLGKPAVRERAIEPWASQIAELARFPNVWCKLSGLVTEANHTDWRRAQLHPYIDHAIDCFGPTRVMYGGDWPVSLLATTYQEWLDTLSQAIAGREEIDPYNLFYETGRQFYRIESK